MLDGRKATDLDQLAAKLGRPTTDLLAFGRLSPDQFALLSDAIDEACAGERRAVEAGLANVIPRAPARILIKALRSQRR